MKKNGYKVAAVWAMGVVLGWGLMFSATAKIQAASTEPPPSVDATESEPVLLTVDDKNIYPGMDKAYEKGYIPSVSDGKVHILLPLLLESGTLRKDEIRVSLDLGDPDSSPFVFENLIRTVPMASHKVAGQDTLVDAFLVQVDLPLVEKHYRGRYPVTLLLSWVDHRGVSGQSESTVFVTLESGLDPHATPSPMPEATPVPTVKPKPAPKVLLSSVSLSDEALLAGDTVQVTVTFKNTAVAQDISNIKVTVQPDDAELTVVGSTGSFYISEILSEGETSVVFYLSADAKVTAGSKSVTVDVEYEDEDANSFSESEKIRIPVRQPLRLEYDTPTVPESISVGETLMMSFHLMNPGISTIYNARVQVEAPGFIPDKTLFLGNIESGSSKQEDMYIFVTMRTRGGPTPADGEDYGVSKGVATITYEDSYGQVYEEFLDFSTEVVAMVIPTRSVETENPDEVRDRNQWELFVIGGFVLLVVVVAAVAVWRRNERRRLEMYGFEEDSGAGSEADSEEGL